MSRLPPLALAYHGVARVPLRDDPHGLFTAPEALLRHVDRLRRWGYELVTFGTLAERVRSANANGLAALTFDDGFADNLHELVPTLARVEAPATVFVVAGLLGQAHPDFRAARFLDACELRELSRRVEIGSHGMGHVDLTALTFEQAHRELLDARSALEHMVERTVDLVAYPFGRVTSTVMRAAQEAGYRAGAGVSGKGGWDQPFHLPRQDMTNSGTMLSLRLKRANRYEPLMRVPLIRMARTARRRLVARL